MRSLLRHLLVIAAMCALVHADNILLPPKDLRGEWAELDKLKFSEWRIKRFNGWDMAFDGGSKVFFLESEAGEKFDLMVANSAYWTAEDKKENRQVFIIIHKNKLYRIEPKSDEEKNMIEKLTNAAGQLAGEGKKDPKLLAKLAERLKSRESQFNPKGCIVNFQSRTSHGAPTGHKLFDFVSKSLQPRRWAHIKRSAGINR